MRSECSEDTLLRPPTSPADALHGTLCLEKNGVGFINPRWEPEAIWPTWYKAIFLRRRQAQGQPQPSGPCPLHTCLAPGAVLCLLVLL